MILLGRRSVFLIEGLPLALDRIDVALITALLEDGRRSYRQLAKIASVSTPTAEARIKRMLRTGFIKRIGPVLDLEKVNHGVSAVVCLKVASGVTNDLASYLSSLEEVRNVFLTTGECNLMVRIACSSTDELQSILDTKICNRPNVNLVNSHVVTRTIKDEQGLVFKPDIQIRLECNYCGGEIKGTPLVLRVGEGERYLCCKTCLNSYKEKYALKYEARIAARQKDLPNQNKRALAIS